MSFSEENLLPLSALQHLLLCPRQAALIHVEQLWAENQLTVEGQLLHRRAHEAKDEWRGTTRIVRSLPIRSFELGLVGKTDIVEIDPLAAVGNAPNASRRKLFGGGHRPAGSVAAHAG